MKRVMQARRMEYLLGEKLIFTGMVQGASDLR